MAVPVTGSHLRQGSAWRCWQAPAAVAVTSNDDVTVAPEMVTLPETVAPSGSLAVLAAPLHAAGDLAALAVKLAGKLSVKLPVKGARGRRCPSMVEAGRRLRRCWRWLRSLAMLAPTWW